VGEICRLSIAIDVETASGANWHAPCFIDGNKKPIASEARCHKNEGAEENTGGRIVRTVPAHQRRDMWFTGNIFAHLCRST